MPIDNSDLPWLAKAAYAGAAALIGGAAGVFGMGIKLAQRDAQSVKRDERIKALEDAEKERIMFCNGRRDEIIKQVSDRLCHAFRELIHEERMADQNYRTRVEVTLAILEENNKIIKEHVTEIYGRMNRRRGDDNND